MYLQTHRLHAGDGSEQKAVIEIIEELDRVVDAGSLRVILKE